MKPTDKIVWDERVTGLGERTRATGSKRFILQYRVGTQQRRITMKAGITRAQARKLAQQLLGEVAKGIDPQAVKLSAKATETFKAVAERFLAFQAKKLRASSLYSTQLYLLTHCKRLHALKVEAVTRREISSILSSIAEKSGPTSADRARAALSAMFAWAICEGLAETNPTMNTNVYAGAVQRDRVLTKEEIVAIWNALPDSDYGRIVKLLFYTGARADEIAQLRWDEIDISERQINLPAERSKNHRAFILPLSEPALDLLGSRADRRYLFGQDDTGFSGWSKAKASLDAKLKINPWQLRDIRRTVATSMANIGIQPHIVEAVLNHVSGAKAGVAGIYNRATYAKEKREALDTWANHIAVLLAQASGANVVPLVRG